MSAILSWAREVSAAVGGAEQERYCTTLEAPAMPTSRAMRIMEAQIVVFSVSL